MLEVTQKPTHFPIRMRRPLILRVSLVAIGPIAIPMIVVQVYRGLSRLGRYRVRSLILLQADFATTVKRSL